MPKPNKITGSKVVRHDANALTEAVIKLFNLNRFHLFRVNTGVFEGADGRRNVRSAPTGTPDILGYCPNGNFVAIEIKVGKDKVSPAQRQFLTAAAATPNGRAAIIGNLDEATEFLATF